MKRKAAWTMAALVLAGAIALLAAGARWASSAQDMREATDARSLVAAMEAALWATKWASEAKKAGAAVEGDVAKLAEAAQVNADMAQCVADGTVRNVVPHCLARLSKEGELWGLRASRWASGRGGRLLELVKGAGLSEEWEATAKWVDAVAAAGPAPDATADAAMLKTEAKQKWESAGKVIASVRAEAEQRVAEWKAEASMMAEAAAKWDAEAKAIARAKAAE